MADPLSPNAQQIISFLQLPAANINGEPVDDVTNANALGLSEDWQLYPENITGTTWEGGQLRSVTWNATGSEENFLFGELSLSGCTDLQNVEITGHKLTGLVIRGSEMTKSIDLSDNILTNIDIRDCVNLEDLYLIHNCLLPSQIALPELKDNFDLSGQNINFEYFTVYDGQFSLGFDFSRERKLANPEIETTISVFLDNNETVIEKDQYFLRYNDILAATTFRIDVYLKSVLLGTCVPSVAPVQMRVGTVPDLNDATLTLFVVTDEYPCIRVGQLAYDQGSYISGELPPGKYLLSSEAPGFLRTYYSQSAFYPEKWENASTIEILPTDDISAVYDLEIALSPWSDQGGTVIINGSVTDGVGNTAIGQTNVLLYRQNATSYDYGLVRTTRLDGNSYQFESLPAGLYEIHIDYPGYESDGQITVRASENSTCENNNFYVDVENKRILTRIDYNEHDKSKLYEFLKLEASDNYGEPAGYPNAKVLLSGYTDDWDTDPDWITRVWGVTWENGRIVDISWSEHLVPNIYLAGTMDFSGCEYLESVSCNYMKLAGVKLENCNRLKGVTLAYNMLQQVDLSGCNDLVQLDLGSNRLLPSGVKLPENPGEAFFLLMNGQVVDYLSYSSDIIDGRIKLLLDLSKELTFGGMQLEYIGDKPLTDGNMLYLDYNKEMPSMMYGFNIQLAFPAKYTIGISCSLLIRPYRVKLIPSGDYSTGDESVVCYLKNEENKFFPVDTLTKISDGGDYYYHSASLPQGEYIIHAAFPGYKHAYYNKEQAVFTWQKATVIRNETDDELEITLKLIEENQPDGEVGIEGKISSVPQGESMNSLSSSTILTYSLLSGEKQLVKTVKAGTDGDYSVSGLPNDIYLIEADVPGFQMDGNILVNARTQATTYTGNNFDIYEKDRIIKTNLTIADYNDHDSTILITFLKQKASGADGTPSEYPNAMIVMEGYTVDWVNDPQWISKVKGVEWEHSPTTGVEWEHSRITGIDWNAYLNSELKLSGKLDLSSCGQMRYFLAENQNIEEADFTACTHLEIVSLNNNELRSVDFSDCKKIDSMNLEYNKLLISNIILPSVPEKLFFSHQDITGYPYTVEMADGILAVKVDLSNELLFHTIAFSPEWQVIEPVSSADGVYYFDCKDLAGNDYAISYELVSEDNQYSDLRHHIQVAYGSLSASVEPRLEDALIPYYRIDNAGIYPVDTIRFDHNEYRPVYLPEGEYIVSAEAPGYLFTYYNVAENVTDWESATRITIVKDSESYVSIPLETEPTEASSGDITISGQLIYSEDIEGAGLKAAARPFKNSTVLLYSSKEMSRLSFSENTQWFLIRTVKPDEVTGAYSFTGLPAGNYMVKVEIAGFVSEGENIELNSVESGNRYLDNNFVVNEKKKTIIAKQPITTGNTENIRPELKIYPNPVVDIVRISGLEGEYTVRVINVLGQIVAVVKDTSAEIAINIGDKPSGMYLIRIEANGKVKDTRKIIKR